MSVGARIVRGAAPIVRGINRFNPAAGRAAYNATARIARGATAIAPKVKGLFKAAPYVGAGITALDAYGNYQSAIASGEDPGRSAFMGIGSTLGGFAGGTLGATLGPVGVIGGGIAGSTTGRALFGRTYDGISDMLGGGKQQEPVSYSMSPEEQRAYRQQMRSQGRGQRATTDDNRTDIAGFRYSPDADTGLVALRMQQQAGNIATVQQLSAAKHLSNNQLRAMQGQQGVDRYGLGQMYMTDRYRAGLEAGVMNRQTDAGRAVSLGQQYTERFLGGKGLDNQRYLGSKELDNQRLLGMRSLDVEGRRLDLDYGDRREERQARERMYGVDAGVRRRMSDNSMAVGALASLSNLYR